MTFDYTAEANKDTLKGGALQGYRLIHWLADILRNWFSDPINIKDERICKLLRLQDGDSDDRLKALFDVGTPYATDSKKAGATPMILVCLGDTSYPVRNISMPGADNIAENGACGMHRGMKYRAIAMKVSVTTESYDGTVLLANLIEDFLCINEYALVKDNGSISSFTVTGSSAPTEIKQGSEANAKTLYQINIGVAVVGGVSWITDTQGPVFRGIKGMTTTLN